MAGGNQLLDNMLHAAKERLAGRNPEQIARCADVKFENGAFRFLSLGREIGVSWPDLNIAPELPHWQLLTLLHYLDLADGAPLTGRMKLFSAYRDGMVRGSGFDREAEEVIREKLGVMPSELLQKRCLALDGEILPSNADLCACIRFAPRYPVWLKLWFADDEFPASGRMFVDEGAEHYLTIEDAVTVGMLVFDALMNGI
ncbi:MAG: DUF3786 domain-containing protein [Clostridia bacterium]|nr:DUF3786 domain-containing protein [Clostridia bacterium]